MSNKIVPVDAGLHGKVNQKSGRAVSADSTTAQPGAKAATGATPTDTVELTGNARLLAQADEALTAMPPIDNTKVEDVQRAIRDGEYVVDAKKIADALLRSDLELSK